MDKKKDVKPNSDATAAPKDGDVVSKDDQEDPALKAVEKFGEPNYVAVSSDKELNLYKVCFS